MQFIPIHRDGFPAWREMRQMLYGSLTPGFHDEEMEKALESDDWYCCFVMDGDGQTMGFFELSSRNLVDGCRSSPVAYLEGLYLKPAFRRRGRGREVLHGLAKWCKAKGYSELATDAELENATAQNFFLHMGFKETFRIVEYRLGLDET